MLWGYLKTRMLTGGFLSEGCLDVCKGDIGCLLLVLPSFVQISCQSLWLLAAFLVCLPWHFVPLSSDVSSPSIWSGFSFVCIWYACFSCSLLVLDFWTSSHCTCLFSHAFTLIDCLWSWVFSTSLSIWLKSYEEPWTHWQEKKKRRQLQTCSTKLVLPLTFSNSYTQPLLRRGRPSLALWISMKSGTSQRKRHSHSLSS